MAGRAIVRPFRWCCCCSRQANDYESLYGSQYDEDFQEHNASNAESQGITQQARSYTGTISGTWVSNLYACLILLCFLAVQGGPSTHMKDGHYQSTPPMNPSYGTT